MKCCSICKSEKEYSEFCKDSSRKDGYSNKCKFCKKIKKQIYLQNKNNKPDYNITKKCNVCEIVKPGLAFNKNKTTNDGLTNRCKECVKIESKQYYNKNKEKIKSKTGKYYREKKEKVNISRRKRAKERQKTDILWKLKRRLRNRLYYALKRTDWLKNTHFSKYIGCSLEQLKIHLQQQFKEGMDWNNYGKWHIDHIIPLSSANTEEDLYKLCHYTNLQPLWSIDNILKGNKF